jgi:hypothetical protein
MVSRKTENAERIKIIASIKDPQVIGRILEHLGLDGSDDIHGESECEFA